MCRARILVVMFFLLLQPQVSLHLVQGQDFGPRSDFGTAPLAAQQENLIVADEYRLMFDAAIRPDGGLEVVSVVAGGPATRLVSPKNPNVHVVLEGGDVVTAIDSHPIRTLADYHLLLNEAGRANRAVVLTVRDVRTHQELQWIAVPVKVHVAQRQSYGPEYQLLFQGAIRPEGGLEVVSVAAGGPATRLRLHSSPAITGSLQSGDVVTWINGRRINSLTDYYAELNIAGRANQRVVLTVRDVNTGRDEVWEAIPVKVHGVQLPLPSEPENADSVRPPRLQQAGPAVTASTQFAFGLYHQLARDNAGDNLLFSPYSVSTALTMAAEGARGETALEMGRVLGFPDSARRNGLDADEIPWDLGPIHAGMAELGRLFSAQPKPRDMEVRARIVELRKQFEAASTRAAKAREAQDFDAYSKAAEFQNALASELNGLLVKVDQYELRVANALWAERTYPLRDSYLATIARYFGTDGAFQADFRNRPEAERARINGWVEQQTNRRITNLLPQGTVDEYTRLVLTNAVYFRGEWSMPFRQELTKPGDFTLSDGRAIQVSMMHAAELEGTCYAAFNADGSFFATPKMIDRGQTSGLYPDEDGFAMLEIRYKGGDLAMVVIAPNTHVGLPALEAELTVDNVNTWFNHLDGRTVNVFLPKFRVESDYRLTETLEAMGMVRAFTDPRKPNGAQFGGMTTSTDPMEQLCVGLVMHKAFVEVNEKGTEAAAATALGMKATSYTSRVHFVPDFKADSPFIYLIRDRRTGTLLFLGRMMQPNT